jgi:hypothetical protein
MRAWRQGAGLALLLAGCATTPVPDNSVSATAAAPAAMQALVDPTRRPGKALILIAMPDLDSFRAVRRSLVEEIRKEFDVVTSIVDPRTSPASFAATLASSGAVCVVLMNNPTVNLYRSYQRGRKGQGPVLPAVVVMSSFLEEVRDELDNATGVAYEVPGVTSFVNLRSMLQRPVRRVGVVHRPAFRRFVQRQAALARPEQITLVPQAVPNDAGPAEVRQALLSLKQSGVDALWVLNDNRLLGDGAFLETAWREAIDNLAVPVVVGVPALVNPELRFGTLAVLPDLDALGVQTANLLMEVAEDQWRAGGRAVELPVSTVTLMNMQQARLQFPLREGALQRIDRKLE